MSNLKSKLECGQEIWLKHVRGGDVTSDGSFEQRDRRPPLMPPSACLHILTSLLASYINKNTSAIMLRPLHCVQDNVFAHGDVEARMRVHEEVGARAWPGSVQEASYSGSVSRSSC
jgi:hypothetical protein